MLETTRTNDSADNVKKKIINRTLSKTLVEADGPRKERRRSTIQERGQAFVPPGTMRYIINF